MDENVADAIKKLGGPAEVAANISVEGEQPKAAAVAMWASRNTIPWKWRAAFEQYATGRRQDA